MTKETAVSILLEARTEYRKFQEHLEKLILVREWLEEDLGADFEKGTCFYGPDDSMCDSFRAIESALKELKYEHSSK